jgi:hypothetical protein
MTKNYKKDLQSANNSSAQATEKGKEKGNCISIFNPPIWNKMPSGTWTIAEVAEYIKSDAAKKQVEELATITDKEKRREYKARNFMYATYNAYVEERTDDQVIELNGFIAIDIDLDKDAPREEIKQLLLNDPLFTTVLLTNSVGYGIHWVVEKTASLSNRTWYDAIACYLSETYDIDPDMCASNVSRAFFLGHDPECYINPVYSNFNFK